MEDERYRITVDATRCVGCRLCERACPVGAMHVDDKLASIDYERCIACGMCATKCRMGAIHDSVGLFATAR